MAEGNSKACAQDRPRIAVGVERSVELGQQFEEKLRVAVNTVSDQTVDVEIFLKKR